MTLPEAEHRTHHPDLPVFDQTAYGVQVSWVGDENETIAHGHINPLRFLAACNKLARDAGLANIADDKQARVEDLVERIWHRWAVRAPKCKCPGRKPTEMCRLGHDIDPDPEQWYLWCGMWAPPGMVVTENTPGAFPVTTGRWD
jgi:hypothetical protein